MATREQIIGEIKRVALTNGGKAPGQTYFGQVTGIASTQWRGIHWARWGDALAEAGFEANEWNQRHSSDAVLRQVAHLTRRLGKVPTKAELMLERRANPTFPHDQTVGRHFKISGLPAALRELAASDIDYADLLPLLPKSKAADPLPTPISKVEDGWVYLLKSGEHFKIGRSDTLERRVKEISISLPESVVLVHAIKTDDPVGIEAYWHRRFADRRANGEWFRLDRADLAAFKRRTFQ